MNVVSFRPRHPIVTVEFARVGWDVVLIDQRGRREIIDDGAGTVEPAIDEARRFARYKGARFVPGGARSWIDRLSSNQGSRA